MELAVLSTRTKQHLRIEAVRAAMVKVLGGRKVAQGVRCACAKGASNLVHALSLSPPWPTDHADPAQVRNTWCSISPSPG